MVPPVDPVGLATLSFILAAKAWTTFKTALHFSDDANDLILRLNIEQARFHLWSRNAGYEKVGDSFDKCLLPVVELVDHILKKLTALFEDAEQLRTRCGLIENDTSVDESKKLQRFLTSLNKALHITGIKTTPTPEGDESLAPPAIHRISTLKRARWGIRDKIRFQELVEAVENHLLKLNQLLNDSQQKKLAEDIERLNALIVGSIQDAATLQVVRSAAQARIQDDPINNLCGRLALSDRMPSTEGTFANAQFALPPTEFPCVVDFRGTSTARALARRTSAPGSMILLERKAYQANVSREEFNLLSNRVKRLVLLLRVQRADLRTLRCIGYIHDSPGRCWWIAFDYPTTIPALISSQAPISLLDLFADKSPIRPALEDRIILASRLASSVSGLFNSSWLHKSIRSENILFPNIAVVNSGTKTDAFTTASPFLTGFEYSRQHTERSLGKPWHKDIFRAIYRHPFYQGQAPGSYRSHYDMYSFGLVLVEIARWMPLSSFLEIKKPNDGKASPPQLSLSMDNFTEVNAKELQKRLLYFVDTEMAFRVGMPYREAARWCLTHADETIKKEVQQVLGSGGAAVVEADWRPALDFYNNVVVPLERLAQGIGAMRLSGY